MGIEITNCFKGNHPFEEILRKEFLYSDTVVKWCPVCGSVVIDEEADGRIYPGKKMTIKSPKIAKEIQEKPKTIKNNYVGC